MVAHVDLRPQATAAHNAGQPWILQDAHGNALAVPRQVRRRAVELVQAAHYAGLTADNLRALLEYAIAP